MWFKHRWCGQFYFHFPKMPRLSMGVSTMDRMGSAWKNEVAETKQGKRVSVKGWLGALLKIGWGAMPLKRILEYSFCSSTSQGASWGDPGIWIRCSAGRRPQDTFWRDVLADLETTLCPSRWAGREPEGGKSGLLCLDSVTCYLNKDEWSKIGCLVVILLF